MQIPTKSVVVRARVRQDMGDIDKLKESLRSVGQLTPIVVTRENELIAGHRRLLAATALGWSTIDAVSVDRTSEVDKLQMELEENVVRKDFTAEEIIAGYRQLEALRRPRLKRRLGAAFRRIGAFCGALLWWRKKKKKAASEPVSARDGTPGSSSAKTEDFTSDYDPNMTC